MTIKTLSSESMPAVLDLPSDPTQRSPWFMPIMGLIVLICLGIAVAVGFWWGKQTVTMPQEGSAEVGFARDMATHHAQAVDMTILLRDRTSDSEMRFLALDMMLTQQAQIGQMQGWLAVWGQTNSYIGPTMAWAGMPTTGLMPGMATVAELNHLRTLSGVDADGLFIIGPAWLWPRRYWNAPSAQKSSDWRRRL